MGTRGKRSAADMATVRVDGSPMPLQPRPGAPEAVQAIFSEIIGTVPTTHFRASDAPLVEAFAQAIYLFREAGARLATEGPVIDGKRSPWLDTLEKAHKSAVALSSKLRLNPMARLDPKDAGRNRNRPIDKPWQTLPSRHP